jgi:hypothetical protein
MRRQFKNDFQRFALAIPNWPDLDGILQLPETMSRTQKINH